MIYHSDSNSSGSLPMSLNRTLEKVKEIRITDVDSKTNSSLEGLYEELS